MCKKDVGHIDKHNQRFCKKLKNFFKKSHDTDSEEHGDLLDNNEFLNMKIL
jgi:hypothetical protein